MKTNGFVPSLPTSFSVIEDCLHIGGIALPRLAQRVGGTPFYAYDRQAITQRVKELRAVLPPEMALHYSIKANPMAAVVQHLAALVDGFDVASGGELTVALDAGMRPEHISMTGPGKTDEELRMAIAAEAVIHVESERELNTVVRLGEQLGVTPRVMLRVNPDFELKSSGMKMGGGAKPFGIDAEAVPRILARVSSMGVLFRGFHIFSGSQNLRTDAVIEEKSQVVELALQLAEQAGVGVSCLNIGGGFGIPYFPGDGRLDMVHIGEHLHQCVARVKSRMPEAKIVLELGRYLVGESGIYVTRVVERKTSRGQVFLVTDGGLNHHLPATGNFGQVIRRNYPVVIGNRVQGTNREVVSVVGPLCTPLDLLADKVEMSVADIGDLVVVLQSGAYGLTASPIQFLSHPLPREVLV